jgi:hypothetical protein
MSQAADIAKFAQAWVDWNAEHQNLRFGQYVMNTYFPHARCPSVFYEPNAKQAYNLIFDHFIMGEDLSDWVD